MVQGPLPENEREGPYRKNMEINVSLEWHNCLIYSLFLKSSSLYNNIHGLNEFNMNFVFFQYF